MIKVPHISRIAITVRKTIEITIRGRVEIDHTNSVRWMSESYVDLFYFKLSISFP